MSLPKKMLLLVLLSSAIRISGIECFSRGYNNHHSGSSSYDPIISTAETTANPSSENNNGDLGILDTFSLSFVGNFNFANAIDGVKKIVEGVGNCNYIN